MSLTLGGGPFSRSTTGQANFERVGPAHALWFEDFPRRLRAVVGGETILDTRGAKLLHETGLLPVAYVPVEDVRADVLTPTGHTTHCPFKGDASYWTVRAGGKVLENVVWGYPSPLAGAPDIAGFVAFYFDRLDEWYEEDERVQAHLRDPYHRVDVRAGSYRVVVRHEGTVLADSARPKLLFETGAPTRWYLPAIDVRTDLLRRSDTVSHCPYKGEGHHWHVVGEGVRVEDAGWSLPHPLPEAFAARDHYSFYPTKVDIEVDGVRIER
jgi:uncharacterized protein (DUF427 family)